MAIKVGINGFGRIGRMVFRAGLKNPEYRIRSIKRSVHDAGLHGVHAQVRHHARPL